MIYRVYLTVGFIEVTADDYTTTSDGGVRFYRGNWLLNGTVAQFAGGQWSYFIEAPVKVNSQIPEYVDYVGFTESLQADDLKAAIAEPCRDCGTKPKKRRKR